MVNCTTARAWGLQVQHGALQSACVLLTNGFQAKIGDVGLAQLAEHFAAHNQQHSSEPPMHPVCAAVGPWHVCRHCCLTRGIATAPVPGGDSCTVGRGMALRQVLCMARLYALTALCLPAEVDPYTAPESLLGNECTSGKAVGSPRLPADIYRCYSGSGCCYLPV